jgi:hypothetical protein
LPLRFQSVDHATQLAILCFSDHVKKYGYSAIFKKLIEEITILETTGIMIEFNNQQINLRGTVSYVVADNLAANSFGGFVESFSCMVSGNKIQ